MSRVSTTKKKRAAIKMGKRGRDTDLSKENSNNIPHSWGVTIRMDIKGIKLFPEDRFLLYIRNPNS